jgi:cytochrome c556
MKRSVIAVTLALSAAALVVHAQMKPEDQVKQRRAGMAIIGYNFASLAAMAQEKKPFNKDEAARNADLVVALSEYPKNFFGEGTDKVGDTKALPEVWSKRADFDEKMKKMNEEVKKLPPAARGDLAAVKAAVGDVAKACKACHDDFRAKQS